MTHSQVRFISFPSSIWSEKAHWVLDFCRIPYTREIYTPLISTPRVRYLAGNLFGKLTLPIITYQSEVYSDSYTIAQFANAKRAHGAADLFPVEHLTEINEWEALSQQLMDRCRIKALVKMKTNQQSLENNLPAFIPKALRPHLRFMTKIALSNFQNKYPIAEQDPDLLLRQGLLKLRAKLKESKGYILKEFSYADITMATAIVGFKPVDTRYMPIDDATIDSMTDDRLAEEFADLIAWRDQLYATFRLPKQDDSCRAMPTETHVHKA